MSDTKIKKIVQIPDNEILRGRFYWSAIPYSEKRPMYIFSKNMNSNYGKRVKEINAFTGVISNGNLKSNEVDIIIRHKRRLALVVQSDVLNNDSTYQYVYVIPITTFKKDITKIHYIRDNNDDIIQYHYIGSVTGSEAVAKVSDIKRIHKSLLLEKTNITKIDSYVLDEICKKVAEIMNIEKLEKCDECIYNYENYVQPREEVASDKIV